MWSNHPVDYTTGSTLDHHLLSHKMTLNMQVKQYGNAVVLLDGMLLREQELVAKTEGESSDKASDKSGDKSNDKSNDKATDKATDKSEKEKEEKEKKETKAEKRERRRREKEPRAYRETVDSAEVDEQETLTSDHVNDYVHVLYRMELLGEGMGDRWAQVLDLLRRTHKRFLTPVDTVYRALLFSVTGQEAPLQALLSGDAAREQDALWQELQLRGRAPLP